MRGLRQIGRLALPGVDEEQRDAIEVPEDMIGDGAQHGATETASAVRGHHHEFGAPFLGELDDLLARTAFTDLNDHVLHPRSRQVTGDICEMRLSLRALGGDRLLCEVDSWGGVDRVSSWSRVREDQLNTVDHPENRDLRELRLNRAQQSWNRAQRDVRAINRQ